MPSYPLLMRQLSQASIFVCWATLAAFPSVSSASTLLECKPGARKLEYVKASYLVRTPDKRRLQQQLATWGGAKHYEVYGQRGEDASVARRETWTSVLVSPRRGVRIEVQFTDGSQTAFVRIKNQCWNHPEGWQQHWLRFQSRMSSWGYRRIG